MKKLFSVLVLVLVLVSCTGQTANENPPLTYSELIIYKGTNKSLYKYIMLTAIENKPLFDEWFIEMSNQANFLSYNPEKVALLKLFSWYYQGLETVLNYQTANQVNKKKLRSIYKEYIIQNRGLWEELIDNLRDDNFTINVRKTDVDELTNFFIKYKF